MEIWEIISQVGFPIAVAGYLLTVFRDTIEKNTTAINKLTEVLNGKKS